jgi:hypothetical protein
LYKKSDVLSLLNTLKDNKKNTLNSKEVCQTLGISKQLLLYWRKTNKIKFKVMTNKNIRYEKEHIQELLTTRLRLNQPSKQTITKKSVETEIKNWIRAFSYKIAEQKYSKQLFFLNFGNVGIVSSPQVMISDDFKLVDVIHGITLIEDSTKVLNYLNSLSDKSLKPLIDTSKEYYEGFGTIYLNKLYSERLSS